MKSTALSMAALTWIGFALILLVAGCDPIWGTRLTVRGPDHVPVRDAVIAIACPGSANNELPGWVSRTGLDGTAFVGSLGTQLPPDCDLFIAAPGLPVRRVRYDQLCPGGAGQCDRMVDLDLALAR